MTSLVIDMEVLDAAETAKVGETLRAIERHWTVRGEGFATLGVASYLDVMHSDDPEKTYYDRVPAQNAVITAHFGWLIERIRAIVEKRFAVPTVLAQDVALPGFHIFYGPGITLHDRDSQHFDLQFRSMRWPTEPDEELALSFTLAIELPADGSGLDYWAFTEDDLLRQEKLGRSPSMALVGRTKPFIRHPYRVGTMAVQLKSVMHRIAATPSLHEGDHRITMQGHAIGQGDHLVMYW